MTALQDLLEHAASDPTEVDTAADLRRGHLALSRRRTRIAAGVAGITGGLVAAGSVGYAALPRQHDTVIRVSPGDDTATAPPVTATKYYDVPTPPDGWHVVGERPQYVMLARDGSGVTSVDASFVGQLVIGLADGREGFDTGATVTFDGRTFYVNDRNDDATILSVRDPGGDWLQAQYPPASFTVHQMIAYLDHVDVRPAAGPAHG
jgi:hypothetical protein